MKTTCPKCGSEMSGKVHHLRCPECSAPLGKSPTSRSGGRASSKKDLLDEILAEVRQFQAAAQLSPEPALAGAAVAAPVAAPVRAPARARPRRRASRPASSLGYAVVVVFGVLIVLGAAVGAYYYVTTNMRSQTALKAIGRAESKLVPAQNALEKAEGLRNAKDFPKALAAFSAVKSLAESMRDRLREDTSGLKPGAIKGRADGLLAEIKEYVDRADKALKDPKIKFGGQGKVQFDGLWVTPEEQKLRFEAKMRQEGKRLYQKKWLTEDQIQALKGNVRYKDGWVKKSQLAQLIAQDAKRNTGRTTAPKTEPKKPAAPPKTRRNPGAFDPGAPKWIMDDFTGKLNWTVVSWPNANPCGLAVQKKDGKPALRVTLSGGREDKSAIVRPLPVDISSRGALTMDMVNECGEPVRLAIAFETDMYYESRWRTLKIGPNKGVKFDLKAGDFKSAKTRWAHSAQVGGLKGARFLYLLVYYNRPGKLFVENTVALGGP